MGKETKIKIKYRAGELPERLSETLSNADETDLRILVSLMMLADNKGVASVSALSEVLGLDKSSITGSLKYWRGAGIIENARETSDTEKSDDLSETKKESSRIKTAHRNGAVEKSGTLDTYSSGELASIMEKRRVSAQFIDEAQRVVGKMFRTYDTGILVGIVDRLGFEEEAVLVILNYIVGKGKKTMRYAETVAMALYDEGITETADVIERIGKMERAGEVISQIRTLYGIGDRALTTTEKKFFTAWTENFAYDIDVIRMAYDITVDNTQKPLPKYTNTILERWHAEGLRTADEVRKYLERQSAERGASTVAKSYDTDDFFEAALQRSYEDIK